MNAAKNYALGMNASTASHRLRKQIMFNLVVETGRDKCFRCGLTILTADELSIEHKEAWLRSDDPVKNFFEWSNIAFSHLTCNITAERCTRKYKSEDERKVARRPRRAALMRKSYTPESRRERYVRTGN